MRDAQLKVQHFMDGAGQLTPRHPTIPSPNILYLRKRMLWEEFVEREDAEATLLALGLNIKLDINDPDTQEIICEIIDSWCDAIYLILGDAVAMGIDLTPFFDEVHNSNATKLIDGRTGPDGKFLKGSAYRSPKLLPILKDQIASGRSRQ